MEDKQRDKLVQPLHDNWYPRVLVIGPGGVKGLKVLGFLCPLEDSGILNYIDTYCGVSVGAIISLLIICGYNIRDIIREAIKIDIFKELMTFDISSSIENRGFVSSEPIRKILTQLVINKLGQVPTLYGLYMMTGKSFITVTFNASDEIGEIFTPFSRPDVSCIDATMVSISIPFFFYQLIYQGKIYVDGALANPYPIDFFDDGNTNILGIYLKTGDDSEEIVNNSRVIIKPIKNTEPKLPLTTYYLKIICSLIDHKRSDTIRECSDKCKNVCLKTKATDTIGYTMTPETKAMMLVDGFNHGKSFLLDIEQKIQNKSPRINKERYLYPVYYFSESLNS